MSRSPSLDSLPCHQPTLPTVISGIAAPDRQAVQDLADPVCVLSSPHLG